MVKNPNCLEAKQLTILQDSVAVDSDYWETLTTENKGASEK